MSVTGNMKVSKAVISAGTEILNRPIYEGVPMTLDDTAFTEDVVKAGTLIKEDGTLYSGSGDPFGIVLSDVYKDRPQATLLKKAYVNLKRIKKSVGDSNYSTMYSDISTLKTKLPRIEFEEAPN